MTIYFALLAFVTGILYLIRLPKMVRWEMVACYLVCLFSWWAGLTLSPWPIAEPLLDGLGLFVVGLALVIYALDGLLTVLAKVKQFVLARMRFNPSLPETLVEVCRAVELLAARRVGALLVIEHGQPLNGVVHGGIPFDADINADILAALFMPASPVHDGAVIVANGRITRVNVILPLATRSQLPLGLGTRHRSAVGITEKTDAIALIASEQRGEMSVAYQGVLAKASSREELLKLVSAALKGKALPCKTS